MCQLGVGWLNQEGAVIKDNRRDDALAVVLGFDKSTALGALVNIYPVVANHLLGQEFLGALAIGAPGRAVNGNGSVVVGHGWLILCIWTL